MARTPGAPRGRGRASARTPEPLGSVLGDIEQPSPVTACGSCGQTSLTRFRMKLTDGTDVEFISCHRCEQRVWFTAAGEQLTLDDVAARSAKR